MTMKHNSTTAQQHTPRAYAEHRIPISLSHCMKFESLSKVQTHSYSIQCLYVCRHLRSFPSFYGEPRCILSFTLSRSIFRSLFHALASLSLARSCCLTIEHTPIFVCMLGLTSPCLYTMFNHVFVWTFIISFYFLRLFGAIICFAVFAIPFSLLV